MNIELLPIGTHDHPEPHVMRWSELEIAAIRSYAQRCVLHDRNRGGQSLHCLSYDIANEAAASECCCGVLAHASRINRIWVDVCALLNHARRQRAYDKVPLARVCGRYFREPETSSPLQGRVGAAVTSSTYVRTIAEYSASGSHIFVT